MFELLFSGCVSPPKSVNEGGGQVKTGSQNKAPQALRLFSRAASRIFFFRK